MTVFKPLKVDWKKILKHFARELRLSKVDKSTFPGLLKQLCLKLNPAHAISRFRNAGIVPLEKQKMKCWVISVSNASGNNDDSNDRDDNPLTPPRRLIEDEIMTPKTVMREAVKSITAPRPSQETIKILKNKKLSKKQVQSKNGEVLTEDVKETEKKLKEKLKLKEKKTKS